LLNRIRCFDNLCEALFTIHSDGNINVVSSILTASQFFVVCMLRRFFRNKDIVAEF